MRRDNRSGNVWIYERRHGFRVFFRSGAVGASGRLKLTGSKIYDTREEAEHAAEIIRREITTRTRTIGMAIDEYRADMEERQLNSHTVQQVPDRLRRLMEGALELPLAALDYHRCKLLYRKTATAGGWSVGTHHRALEAAKTWGDWCAHRDRAWVKVSPWADVEHIGKKPDHRDKALTVDDARKWSTKALERAGRGDTGALAALIALACNLRPGEITQIIARNVDDNGRLLRVRGRLKSATSHRDQEIPPFLQPLLLALKEGKEPTARLFDFDRDHVADSAKAIAAAAGVPAVDARGLRHTWSSLMARRGVSLTEIGDSMGHADGGRTAARYYVQPSAIAAAASAKIAGLLTDGKEKKAKRRR